MVYYGITCSTYLDHVKVIYALPCLRLHYTTLCNVRYKPMTLYLVIFGRIKWHTSMPLESSHLCFLMHLEVTS